MALQKQGNKVIAKITDLSQESSFNNGDRIVFWCNSTGEAATIDYANLRIDLDHTTFGDLFNEVVNFTTSAATWTSSINESIETLTDTTDGLIDSNKNISDQLEAVKMFIKLILGLASQRPDGEANFKEEKYLESLSDEQKQLYNEIKVEVLDALGEASVDFSKQNLTYLAILSNKVDALEERVATLEG